MTEITQNQADNTVIGADAGTDHLSVSSPISIMISTAMADLAEGAKRIDLAAFLAWREAFLPFRLGFLGPIWITLQLGLWVIAVGLFVGPSLNLDGGHYVAYIAIGFTVYNLFMVFFAEGSQLFLKAKSFILNVPNPFSVYVFKLIFKALIQLVMAMPVIIVAMLYTGLPLQATALYAIPGLLLACTFGFGAGLMLGTITVVMRDMTFAVQAAMRLMMFVTPIFWVLDGDGTRAKLSEFNPIYQYLEVIRAPILGETPEVITWVIVSGLAAAALLVGLGMFAWYRNKLAVWL